jgi:hypothetical protein
MRAMNLKQLSLVAIAIMTISVISMPVAEADRTAIADSLNKLSASAASLAQTAKRSDDRGARKKFGPAAAELGDDLGALARRAAKDVPLKTIAQDAAAVDKDANALVELADEAEDKDERKALRAQAVLIAQGIASVRKAIDAAAATDGKTATAATPKFTGRIFNDSNGDKCGISENMKFAISQNGRQVFTSQLVFPGKDFSLVLEKGSYLVQLLDTTNTFKGQRQLEVSREGWMFRSGCVND